ncbi:MAG: ABC transporter substrate-binding protein [Chloroflexota bacterium]
MENPVGLTRRLSRRNLLGLTLVGGSAFSLLAACTTPAAQTTPAATTVPAAQPAATTAAAKPAATAAAVPATAAPGKPGGPVTIKYLTYWWAEVGRNEAWRATVKKFHESQNDIRIEETGFPFSEFFQKVITQLAGGKLDGDVISFNDQVATRFVKGGYLEPVDSIIDKLGISGKMQASFLGPITKDNKTYALHLMAVPHALIYNKELYEKEGVKQPPATQDEYMDLAKQVTRRPNQFGHAGRSTMPEANGWFQDLTKWVVGYGGVWSKAGKPMANSEPALKAVRAYKRLYDEAMPQATTASDYRRLAWEGKVVQYLDNSANINNLKTGNPAIFPKIYTAPSPWASHEDIAVPSYVGIYSGSTKKDAAKVWWEFVFSKQNLGPLLEASLDIIEPYPGVLSESYLKGLHWVSGYLASKPIPLSTTYQGFEDYNAEFSQAVLRRVSEVLTANRDIEQAMNDAQKDLEELAKRVG